MKRNHLYSALLLCVAAGCYERSSAKTETETHFLSACDDTCGGGLSCVCGVCTEPCSGESACGDFAATASCVATPSTCETDVARACEVECSDDEDCDALGAGFNCASNRCRTSAIEPDAGGTGGSGGAGSGGSGGSIESGGQGSQGGSGGQSSGGTGGGEGEDAGTDAGQSDAGNTTDCNAAGEPCCDPAPGDGPNYCNSSRLLCNGDVCEINCGCMLDAYIPVCGIDGQTYDATCSRECVPMEIACDGECPCDTIGYCMVSCTGIAPDQEAVDGCSAQVGEQECTAFATGAFPAGCQWVTPGTGPCLAP